MLRDERRCVVDSLERTFGFELRRSGIVGAGRADYEACWGEDGLVTQATRAYLCRAFARRQQCASGEQPVDGGVSEIDRFDSPPSDEHEVDGRERRAGRDREYRRLR